VEHGYGDVFDFTVPGTHSFISGPVISHNTVTGRISSNNPNLMNIPAQGETGAQVREFFSVPPGYSFLDIDYSQLELRILAHYTKDKNMLKVFAENSDPHQMTIDLMTSAGFTISRREAKAINFGWAYGIGPRGLCDQIEKASGERPNESDAKRWLMGFEKAYPSAPIWRWKVIDYARELGYVKTIAGRKRRLPELKSPDESLRKTAERQAVNSIIQGSAADIIKWAMLQIHAIQKDYGAKMLAQVHDELAWEVPEAAAQEFGQKAARLMEDGGIFFNLRSKLIAEPGIGANWADAKH
jgi:DNA polymerase-1